MAQAVQLINDAEMTLTAGATINPYVRVKINSSGEAVAAGLTDKAIGYLTHRGATSGEPCTVRLVAPVQGAVAAGAFAVGALLYSAADGEVDDADGGSAVVVGYALDASAADQDVVRILLCD